MTHFVFILCALIFSFVITLFIMPYGIRLLVSLRCGKNIRSQWLVWKAEEFYRGYDGYYFSACSDFFTVYAWTLWFWFSKQSLESERDLFSYFYACSCRIDRTRWWLFKYSWNWPHKRTFCSCEDGTSYTFFIGMSLLVLCKTWVFKCTSSFLWRYQY